VKEKEGPMDRVVTEIPIRNRKSHFGSKEKLERSLRLGGRAETLSSQRGGVCITRDSDFVDALSVGNEETLKKSVSSILVI
jgi:hypothetical protein